MFPRLPSFPSPFCPIVVLTLVSTPVSDPPPFSPLSLRLIFHPIHVSTQAWNQVQFPDAILHTCFGRDVVVVVAIIVAIIVVVVIVYFDLNSVQSSYDDLFSDDLTR